MKLPMDIKLARLRELMKTASPTLSKGDQESGGGGVGLSAYVVPSEDAHQSEYTAAPHKRRQFISGFTGSAATAVITMDKALLWTDGRYFLQAEKELDPDHWQLMKMNTPPFPEIHKWLADNCSRGSYVGIDPTLISENTWQKWGKELATRESKLVPVSQNLVDMVWAEAAEERLAYEEKELFVYPLQYAGEKWEGKVDRVKAQMEEEKCELLVVSELDEIAWLFNLRGSDIEFNPVFFAYAIISANQNPLLFVNQSKLTSEVKQHLEGVVLKPYEEVFTVLDEMVQKCVEQKLKVWMGPQVSHALASTVTGKDEKLLLVKNTPTKMLKAIKNECEVECMRQVHIKDGIALCEYLRILHTNLCRSSTGTEGSSKKEFTEISGSDMLDGLRSQQEGFISLSFDTISGSGPNGAVIHYKASPHTDRKLCADELYLVDSGGQYWEGTTDVTRTVSFLSSPPPKQVETYTLVLKGHIALAELVIPEGVIGYKIDCVARSALWEIGLDYQHGTGHGVGAFLNVHEGPQGISYRTNAHEEGLRENMILSNEPGYYESGQFGIRIESLMVYRKHVTKYTLHEGKKFLKPETITCVPLCRQLIDKSMLSDKEVNWVNDYHQFCWDKLTPLAEKQGKTELIEWLKKQTQPL
ncbi:xaa-Pro aminopeptidase ApepP-like isoform X2 [Symsagittifera roscoffensis]|uniref:xaa-Pro aminopeptidase ApepP-like isoform X2 n=1 Tax=Symsagittifera roscoffensis TaxID=84072 RepID=UPI00307BB93F